MTSPDDFLPTRPGRKHARQRRPRILLCTPEITELPRGMGNAANIVCAKGGGLGDISAGLVRHLHANRRFELHVAMPRFDAHIIDTWQVRVSEVDKLVPVMHGKGIHLVSDSAFAHSSDPYAESEGHPRVQRALALQRQVINQLLDELQPDVVHCNDWMTGLIPAAARERGIRSLFTLHNVFTEYETPFEIDRSGVDVRRFAELLYMERFPDERVDNWKRNRVDMLASGIFAADRVNTVSPTFLRELIAGDFEDIVPPSVRRALRLKHAEGHALGILNAPRDSVTPQVSTFVERFTRNDFHKRKPINRAAFQRITGLRPDASSPLLLWPHRLFAQKAPELVLAIAPQLILKMGAQLALVANGSRELVRAFADLERRYPGRVVMRPFREEISELGKAASDFILMPSHYEPCGLPQMEGMRFGSLPIVRATGGLRDTVDELDLDADTGNGFVFEPPTAEALLAAVERAVAFHRQPPKLQRRVIRRVMGEGRERFSLARTAEQYIEVYEELLGSEAS